MLYELRLEEEIVLRQAAPGNLLLVKKYANLHYGSFAEVVAAFFADAMQEAEKKVIDIPAGKIQPTAACFAVAGVVQQNKSRLTNLDWLIDGPALSEQFGIGCVEIINDFVAQGYGVLTLGDDEVEQLHGNEPLPGAPIACIGAGTGLGQCFLTASAHGEYNCWPSEGGHAEFAPRGAGNDETQINLLKYLKIKFSGWNRISYERVVSGKGICNVYEFLAYSNPSRIDQTVHNEFLADRTNAGTVVRNAVPGTLCHDALKLFADSYGAVCGTFALQMMPFGGLYLTGGVTQKLQSFLKDDPSFLSSYFDKGRVSPMLQDVPLFFVVGDEMGQRGAHLRAVKLAHNLQEGLSLPAHMPDTECHLPPPRNADIAKLLEKVNDIQERERRRTATASNVVLAPVLDADVE